jgi:hypothetical protein
MSFTSLAEYDECPRRWMNQHASDLISDASKWSIRAEAKLSPWDAFAGRIVDDTIRWALKYYVKHGEWPEELTTQSVIIRKQYVEFSTRFSRAVDSRSKWPRELSLQPIDRLYFGEELSKIDKQKFKDTVALCLTNFLTSNIREFICNHPSSEWLIPDRQDEETAIPWFWSGEIPVYANYDFLIRSKELTLIFDWKTGKQTPQSDAKVREQLHMYADHAITEWGVPPEQILLFPVWLAYPIKPDGLEPIPFSLPLLEDLRERWKVRHALLTKLVQECKAEPEMVGDNFPMTEYQTRCGRCVFRSCNGYLKHKGLGEYAVVNQIEGQKAETS